MDLAPFSIFLLDIKWLPLTCTPCQTLTKQGSHESLKSGREHELVFIPQRVADRLREYTLQVSKIPDDRIFPISYEGARVIVAKAGRLVDIKLRPHDLRRHSATYASRSRVPIEIVSEVILRHANLSTTQRYLGTISDA